MKLDKGKRNFDDYGTGSDDKQNGKDASQKITSRMCVKLKYIKY